MDIKKWQLLDEENVSPSKWFPVLKRRYRMPSGRVVDDFYVAALGDAADVVVLTEDNEIVFIRQYRPGADKVMLDLPGGRLDKGESPEEGAKRELLEETGIKAKKLVPLGVVHPAPTKDTTRVHGFLCTEFEWADEQNLDSTEEMSVVKIPADEVREKILKHEICGSDSIAVLYLANPYLG